MQISGKESAFSLFIYAIFGSENAMFRSNIGVPVRISIGIPVRLDSVPVPSEDSEVRYRGKDKDKAVASGKDYAPKRVAGFMARLAKKRETGTNASRLIDEETFVRERHGGRRDRSHRFILSDLLHN